MPDDSQATAPPSKGSRRGLLRRLALGAVAAAAGAVVVSAVTGPSGDLAPRDPVGSGSGVLAGQVVAAPPPDAPQAEVVLRFVGGNHSFEAPTRQGGTFSLELPAGTYSISSSAGEDVCPWRVDVRAGGWQRADVMWPCDRSSFPDDAFDPPPARPGGMAPPAPPGG